MKLSVTQVGLTSLPIMGILGIIITTTSPSQAQTQPSLEIKEQFRQLREFQNEVPNSGEVSKRINETIQNELDEIPQPFINFAGVVAGEEIIAISGQIELPPEQFLQEANIRLDLETFNRELFDSIQTFERIDPRDANFPENPDEIRTLDNGKEAALAINFKLEGQNQLETSIEQAINNLGNDPAVDDVISVVDLFVQEVGERQQSRITAAAAKQNDQDNLNSAVITEVELSPVQQFVDNLDNEGTMLIGVGTDDQNRVLNEIRIESDNQILVDKNNNDNPEVELAKAVEDAGFNKPSDIISLVRAFGDGFEQQQARVSGGALIQDEDQSFTSAVVGEVQLGPGQLIGTRQVDANTNRLVTVTADIFDQINGNNVVGVGQLAINYKLADEDIRLEAAITETINNNNVEQASDVISLVEAFTSGKDTQRLPDEINQVEQIQPEQPNISLD